MKTITVDQYFMGRDRTHGHLLGPDLRREAAATVALINRALMQAQRDGVVLEDHPVTRCPLSSGWRPPDINASTPGAAVRSLHMQCKAGDVFDPDGTLDDWLLASADTVLKEIGLWLEHPAATKGWAHLQTKPPGSGRRVFYP